MKEYFKLGLITFFVSLVLSGLLFTFGPLSFGWSPTIISPTAFLLSFIVATIESIIVVIAKIYTRPKNFKTFIQGFLVGGLVLFIVTYLLTPTVIFFDFLFIEIIYSPGYLLAYLIINGLNYLTTSSLASNGFLIFRLGVLISIIFYTLAGAFLNIWRYKRRGQAQEMHIQLGE